MNKSTSRNEKAWVQSKESFLPIIAVVVVFVSLCFGLGRLPLIEPDEGRNAEIARLDVRMVRLRVESFCNLDAALE